MRRAPIILHVLVHEPARAGGVAHLDQRGELPVNLENMARHLGGERRVLRRPGDVLERDELHHQHAIVRGLGDGEMKFAPAPRKGARRHGYCLAASAPRR